MRPAKSWACSNAFGIIVSASIVRIAPAATAIVAAMTSHLPNGALACSPCGALLLGRKHSANWRSVD